MLTIAVKGKLQEKLKLNLPIYKERNILSEGSMLIIIPGWYNGEWRLLLYRGLELGSEGSMLIIISGYNNEEWRLLLYRGLGLGS